MTVVVMSKATQRILTTIKVSSVILLYMFSIASGVFVAMLSKGVLPTENSKEAVLFSATKVAENKDTVSDHYEIVFTKSEIPEEIRERMMGVTIREDSRMQFEDLSYLTITHIGYDGKSHTGNMIVNKKLADEVLSIFKELYEIKFPIERMELVHKYGGSDELSMRANNTSSFNDRPVSGGTGLSYHQLGQAIDINPLVNPYIKKSVVLPETAHEYTDRTLNAKGMINSDSECVQIFKKYGWTWGGDWTSLKDYQHFEKR